MGNQKEREREEKSFENQVRSKYGLSMEAFVKKFHEKVPWNRSRLMLVGKGRSGKTALNASLQNKKWEGNYASTVVGNVEEAKINVDDVNAGDDNNIFESVKQGGDHIRTAIAAFSKPEAQKKENEEKQAGEET